MPVSPDMPTPPSSQAEGAVSSQPQGFTEGPMNDAFKIRPEVGQPAGNPVPDLISKTGDLGVYPDGQWSQPAEWSQRTQSGEQAKKAFTEGQATPGILNEPMSGAYENVKGGLQEKIKAERVGKPEVQPISMALRAEGLRVLRDVKQKLGIEDSVQLSEDAQKVFKAFVENIGSKTKEGE